MADGQSDATPAASPRAPRFRRAQVGPKLTQDQSRRQSAVATLAWQMLDGRDEIAAFLNQHDAALGGRPLDLAVASDEGFARVETAMRARAAEQGRRMLRDAAIV